MLKNSKAGQFESIKVSNKMCRNNLKSLYDEELQSRGSKYLAYLAYLHTFILNKPTYLAYLHT